MKTSVRIAVLMLMIAGITLIYGTTLANGQEEQKAKTVTVIGKVKTSFDANGNVTRVLLTKDNKTTNSITLTLKGKTLGKEMNGKKVEVTGTLTDSRLTVSAYKEHKPESSKPKE